MTKTKKPEEASHTENLSNKSGLPIEERTIKSGDKEYTFNFLVIDKPDLWLPANLFTSEFTMPIIGKNKAIKFRLNGISYSQWEKMEFDYRTPDEMPRNTKTEIIAYEEAVEKIKNKRKVYLFELSTGKKIEGETIEQKIENLQRIGVGESDALYAKIIDSFAMDGTILQSYNSLISSNTEVIEADSFDIWCSSSESGYSLRMQRRFEDFIIEIPLKQLKESTKKEIEEATREDLPPSRHGKNQMGRIDPSVIEYNYDDPKWKASRKVKARKRLVMQLDALLPFQIPGTTYEEKYNWIGDRLLYDVLTMRNFIDTELFEYSSRINFFLNHLDHQT